MTIRVITFYISSRFTYCYVLYTVMFDILTETHAILEPHNILDTLPMC